MGKPGNHPGPPFCPHTRNVGPWFTLFVHTFTAWYDDPVIGNMSAFWINGNNIRFQFCLNFDSFIHLIFMYLTFPLLFLN